MQKPLLGIGLLMQHADANGLALAVHAGPPEREILILQACKTLEVTRNRGKIGISPRSRVSLSNGDAATGRGRATASRLASLVAKLGGLMHCPECDSTNCESWDFDYGVDKETGYHDAGSGARCLNCKCESYLEDFEDDK